MSDFKFDEAALRLRDGSFKNVKLEDLMSLDKEKYFKEYYGNLFCPECRTPQLKFVVEHHLSTYPKQEHSNNCSYALKPVSSSALTKCLETASKESVNRRLLSLVYTLLKNQLTDTHPTVVRKQGSIYTLDDVKRVEVVGTDKSLKRLPVKLLTAPFNEDDYGVSKLFYGNVSVQYYEKQWKDSTSYSLRLYHPTKNYLIATLSFSQKVKEHIVYPISGYNKKIVNLAFAAEMKKDISDNPNYKFIKGNIIHSHYLVID